MRLLLDTHLLIWATYESAERRLPSEASELINAPRNELYFSAVSIGEIAIKTALGRSSFRFDPDVMRRALTQNLYSELPLSAAHAAGVARLPAIHKDPFDRLLIAQAVAERVTLVTVDAVIARYPGPILKV